ncbi:MAG TPA: hypothetical protein VFO65_14750 [Acidimicrobiales bacterium]|nr:hypothetical protein [Acidimicrobiales bacterium]
MVYAFSQDVPIDPAFYKRIVDGLGDEVPEGLIVHIALARPEGGLRYIDVWESEEAWDRFGEDRLHPVVHALLSEALGGHQPPEPPRSPLPIVHVWGGGRLVATEVAGA